MTSLSDYKNDHPYCEHDNALDPITFGDIVLCLENDMVFCEATDEEVKRKQAYAIARGMLSERMHDYMDMLDVYMDDMVKSASGEESHAPFDPDWEKESLALKDEILAMAPIYGITDDYTILAAGNSYKVRRGEAECNENVDPYRYTQYVRKPNILTILFDGLFYEQMNYSLDSGFYDKLCEIFEKHGLYFELGEAFNLSAYPLD